MGDGTAVDTSRLIAARKRLGAAGQGEVEAGLILVAALLDLAGIRRARSVGEVPSRVREMLDAAGVPLDTADDAEPESTLLIVGDGVGTVDSPDARLAVAVGADGLADVPGRSAIPNGEIRVVAVPRPGQDDPLIATQDPVAWTRALRLAQSLSGISADGTEADIHERLIADLDQQRVRFEDQVRRAEERAASAHRYAEEAHRGLDAIVKSDSWRVTAPIRYAGEFVRRQRERRRRDPASAPTTIESAEVFDPASNVEYALWASQFDTIDGSISRRIEQRAVDLTDGPEFSILMPVYNTPERYLRRAIESVMEQAYTRWELCIADDASTEEHVRSILAEYADRDSRITVVRREENGHISAATNSAYAHSTKPYIALLDHDDELRPHALYVMATHLVENPDHRLVYSDEDRITPDGERFGPHFKPDFNYEQLLGQNYITHFCVIDRRLIDRVGLMRVGFHGSQDHDLMLRCAAVLQRDEIGHVPRVLYHWRVIPGSVALDLNEKPYAVEAGRTAVEEHVRTFDPDAVVEHGSAPATYRVRLSLPDPHPRVSIVIPTRNGLDILRRCIQSIRTLSTYDNYELIIVDNQSDDAATRDYLRVLSTQSNTRVLPYDAAFNYSAINNMAVKEATGEYIVLLNNDTQVVTPGWIEELLMWCARPGIATVGAHLSYPDGSVQHAGLVMGIGGTAGHGHKTFDGHSLGYFGRLKVVHEVGGNTAACLMMRRDVYLAHGGLNERYLAVAYNDVDLCLRLSESGLRHLWTPHAHLIHHESKSRGKDTERRNRARHDREREYLMWRWAPAKRSDPGYNPNLTLDKEDFSLAFPPRVPPLAGTTDPDHAGG